MTIPCCGGKGVSVWKNNMWECSDCGAAKSNDPGGGTASQEEAHVWPKPKCVCGGEKAKTTHAHWCEVKN